MPITRLASRPCSASARLCSMRRSSSAARALASVTHSPTSRSRSSPRVSPAKSSSWCTTSASTPCRSASCWRRVASKALSPCSRSVTAAARALTRASSAAKLSLAASHFVLATLQLALDAVRLLLGQTPRLEHLLLGFGSGGADGGSRFGARGGFDRADLRRHRVLLQARVEQPLPAHHREGAAADHHRRSYIKEEHVTSLQSVGRFGKLRASSPQPWRKR